MATIFDVQAVPKTGTERTLAHVNRGAAGGGFEWIDVDTFPPSPEGDALREARRAAGIGLRDAARRIGVSAAELSGLEFGRYRFKHDAAWAAAARAYGPA